MIPLLDTHLHLINRDKASYTWTKDIPEICEENFTIEDHKLITENYGIGGALFMETGVDDKDYQEETRYVNKYISNPKNILIGIIASIRPEKNEEFDLWLEETLEMGVVGYRRILHVMPDDLSRSQTFRNNINKLGNANKPFDMCFLAKQLPIALELAKSCEKTHFILNHCGVPNIAEEEIDSWKLNIKLLSEMPNVICKLSGLMAYCAPGTSSYKTIEPYVDHILNCFGPKRMVWGSDWPVVNLGKGICEWINVTREIFSKLSEEETKSIASTNAELIYKVKI
tara:strand:+ start:1526 stop:2377 length:852 start_codon:yes stop_codon:yes gene_type:complete